MPQPDRIVDLVCFDLQQRAEHGHSVYGRYLTAELYDRDPIKDAYEELLDAACYLKQLLERRRLDPKPERYDGSLPPSLPKQ